MTQEEILAQATTAVKDLFDEIANHTVLRDIIGASEATDSQIEDLRTHWPRLIARRFGYTS